jgi:ADP-ribosyl-[dinitrogen reductase] hydrolase
MANIPDQPARFTGCLLGLAAGDAVGTTVEFKRRGSFEPVTDMVGGGPFALEPGQWTDDTSMALCLAASLLETGEFSPDDQMRRYCRWRDEGYMSSNGTCFDIGGTVSQALDRYCQTGKPYSGSTSVWSAGNGCIMRLAPVPMYFWRDPEMAVGLSNLSSRTTHGAEECVQACRLFGWQLFKALSARSKQDILFDNQQLTDLPEKILEIALGSYRNKSVEEIRGTGYVVQSLEAALWCFYTTESFEDAILTAVNLGDDADTTAAVCGQIAGAFYGLEGIPAHWRDRLAKREEIVTMAETLREAGGRLPQHSPHPPLS